MVGTIANRLVEAGGELPATNGKGALAIGIAAESQRAMAEIQAALMIARNTPRDQVACIDRIKNACQRIGLAERAEYAYSKGGTEITGPTIDLLTVVAGCWGNVQWGFRELSQQNGESTVECFAWDLESNAKRVLVINIAHKIKAGQSIKTLTDPREIYETVANNAQRRVRSCLESIIPSDVVDEAVEQCRETLRAKDPVTPEKVAKLVEAFAKYGVSKEDIEARIQRRLDTLTPAQMISLKRIGKSLADGMSTKEDWFKAAPAPTAGTDLGTEPKGKKSARERIKDLPVDQAAAFVKRINAATTKDALMQLIDEVSASPDLAKDQKENLTQMCNDFYAAIEQNSDTLVQ